MIQMYGEKFDWIFFFGSEKESPFQMNVTCISDTKYMKCRIRIFVADNDATSVWCLFANKLIKFYAK